MQLQREVEKIQSKCDGRDGNDIAQAALSSIAVIVHGEPAKQFDCSSNANEDSADTEQENAEDFVHGISPSGRGTTFQI